jgi:nitric oxide reductase NorQ protein
MNTIFGKMTLKVREGEDKLIPTEAIEIDLGEMEMQALGIAYTHDKPCLLMGETGTGKTSAVRHLAFQTHSPYVRVNMTGYTTPDELIGSKSVKNGETYYEYGIVTNAMRRGAILVLDEINATTPDCMFILHGLLDEDKRITMPNGDIVRPAEGFRVFATMNPEYEGTKTINKALMDRFPIIIEVSTLEQSKEVKLLQDRTGINEADATMLVLIAEKIRTAYAENKTTIYCSTRSLLNIAELTQLGLPIERAYESVVVKKTANKDEQQFLSDTFKSVAKKEVSKAKKERSVLMSVEERDQVRQKVDAYREKMEAMEIELSTTRDQMSSLLKSIKAKRA